MTGSTHSTACSFTHPHDQRQSRSLHSCSASQQQLSAQQPPNPTPHMSPPGLLIAILVSISLCITASLACYLYHHRAQQCAEHHQWHRRDAAIELSPMSAESKTDQVGTRGCWPHSLPDKEGIPHARFATMRTIPVPYWGPRDEWGPKDGLGVSPLSGLAGVGKRGSVQTDGPVPLRGATTLDGDAASGFPCGAQDRDGVDPARGIWRPIELREGLGGGRGRDGGDVRR
ncbi:uncharacterized protein M421DRAFT_332816 [Didymella exigua CBS 183.55]|uniref:Uncharacterized protein n=1 Tax=Didymella exigua CBS 183.55 TaxID=1150837 RepID=A0A6A5R7B1_9PLEO|nr:uncharacterized protein M421DRAFT_332816 [Didymella exigua CBS 183.55]KAF1923068.1 hypothetical protein M421DRAFT_332816 [Didymella exigua CBS 183.55]